MTLHQLHNVKLWQVAHRSRQPLEYHCWDAMLTAWVMGWAGVPAALLLWEPLLLLACGLMFMAPTLYVAWRTRLHRAGRLRCDWLDSLRQ